MSAVTEGEAKNCWCPYSRVVEGHADEGPTGVRNRVVLVDGQGAVEDVLSYDLVGAKCIGSRCMAWRWDAESPETIQNGTEDFIEKYKVGTETRERRSWRAVMVPNTNRVGYCGLAGKP